MMAGITAEKMTMPVMKPMRVRATSFALLANETGTASIIPGYNLIAVPLAAGVLAPIGFVMPMSVGAILMSISTVVVALNAQLLGRGRRATIGVY